MRNAPRPWLFATGLLTAVLLAGCGATQQDDGGGTQAEAPAGDRAAAGGGNAEAGEDSGPGAANRGDDGGHAGGALIEARDVIYTGEISVRVADVNRAADDAGDLAERYGGFVGEDRRSTDGDIARATVVLRVPSENFMAAVESLAGFGAEESREIQTEDVTEEVVDLETRLATAQASVARTRELLERAESISDVVAVEEELAEREARLASLQAKQRELTDLTTLSTITTTLLAEAALREEAAELGFLTGLGGGWNAFVSTVRVGVTVFGALLPWLVTAAVPAAGAVWWSRRRRAARTAQTAGDAS